MKTNCTGHSSIYPVMVNFIAWLFSLGIMGSLPIDHDTSADGMGNATKLGFVPSASFDVAHGASEGQG